MEATIGVWMWLSTLSHIWEANLDIMLTCSTKFGRINQAIQHSGVIGDKILRFFISLKHCEWILNILKMLYSCNLQSQSHCFESKRGDRFESMQSYPTPKIKFGNIQRYSLAYKALCLQSKNRVKLKSHI